MARPELNWNGTTSPKAAFGGDLDDQLLPEWLRQMADQVDLDALIDVVVRRDVEVAFPTYANDDAFVGHLRASVTENVQMLQHVLCGRVRLSQVRLSQPLAFGAVQAELHIPQTSLQRSYRVGFFEMWEAWVLQVSDCARRCDVSREETVAALTQLTRMIFGYQHNVASQVADNYARAEEALGRSRATVRRQLIQGLLDGDESFLTQSDVATIGYDFSAHHLAVLLAHASAAEAARVATDLRAATPLTHALVHPLTLRSSVVWLARTGPWTATATDKVRNVLIGAGMVAAIGSSEAGLGGFRNGLDQARSVERVRSAWSTDDTPMVLEHAQVSLEILLSQDEDQARAFVRRELRALATNSIESTRLCETLEASFRFGSHVAAASHLGVHEHTVRNRLHRVETILEHDVAARRTEIEVALRLRRVLEAQL